MVVRTAAKMAMGKSRNDDVKKRLNFSRYISLINPDKENRRTNNYTVDYENPKTSRLPTSHSLSTLHNQSNNSDEKEPRRSSLTNGFFEKLKRGQLKNS
jgi:hypothetical protein